jgi:hypothetical protein
MRFIECARFLEAISNNRDAYGCWFHGDTPDLFRENLPAYTRIVLNKSAIRIA